MAAFEIDDRKLARATSHLARRTFEDDKRDLKWSGAFFGLIALFIAWVLYVGWLLLHGLL